MYAFGCTGVILVGFKQLGCMWLPSQTDPTCALSGSIPPCAGSHRRQDRPTSLLDSDRRCLDIFAGVKRENPDGGDRYRFILTEWPFSPRGYTGVHIYITALSQVIILPLNDSLNGLQNTYFHATTRRYLFTGIEVRLLHPG